MNLPLECLTCQLVMLLFLKCNFINITNYIVWCYFLSNISPNSIKFQSFYRLVTFSGLNFAKFVLCVFFLIFQKFASALQIFQLNKKVFQLITFAASACLLSAFIVHVNHGQVLPPSLVSVLPQWLPTLPTFVIKSLHYFLNVELIITGTVLVIQLLTFLAKPWKFGDLIICTCWILIHLQCWLGNWPGIRSYVSLVDFTSIHVSVFVLSLLC